MKYDIFISYRRDGGFETANLIAEKLQSAGYRVFLDVESLRSGKFNEQLLSVIEKCEDFVVVLPKDGLERCQNEDDWVRLEVIHAMKYNKDIVPVMLSGFEWPTVMPEGLEDLKFFQGVAAGKHDYFDASVEKLKKYLKSKPWKRPFRPALWLIAACTCILLIWYILRLLAVPVCKEQVNKITAKMSVIDLLTTNAKNVGEGWEKYYQDYENARVSDTTFLNNQMRELLRHHVNEIKKLQHDTTTFRINGFQHFLLYISRIDVSEIELFHQSVFQSFFDDASHQLALLETFLKMDMVPKISLSSNDQNVRLAQHSANLVYYCYLELLSDMPKKSLKAYKELSISWANFPTTTGLKLPKDEYERLQKTESEKMNSLIGEIGFLTTEQAMHLDREEKKLNRLTSEAKEENLEERINNLIKKSKEIGKKQWQLQDTENKLEDSYRQIIEKCTLLPEDEQYIMWGKIVRVATLMDRVREYREASKQQNEKEKKQAVAQGIDVSDWYEVQYTVSSGDILLELNQRLDAYLSYFPETKSYINAVKQYYTMVESDKQEIGGMIVMGTKDDLLHPVLKLGDIVIARKGIKVNNTDEYKTAKEALGDDILTFLRLDNNGQLVKHSETVPSTDVLIGFLVLKEETEL